MRSHRRSARLRQEKHSHGQSRRGVSGPDSRRAAIVVLAAFLMIPLCCFVAFAVDVGYLCVVRTELQRGADSAALAADLTVW